MCNKENIDPKTGRHAQHPFSPSSPFSPPLLAGGGATKATAPALPAAGGASGRTSIIQKRLFCGSCCGGEGGGQVRLRPAAVAASRKPAKEPLKDLWNGRSSRCM